jgi:hypothetical protein
VSVNSIELKIWNIYIPVWEYYQRFCSRYEVKIDYQHRVSEFLQRCWSYPKNTSSSSLFLLWNYEYDDDDDVSFGLEATPPRHSRWSSSICCRQWRLRHTVVEIRRRGFRGILVSREGKYGITVLLISNFSFILYIGWSLVR